ncbi:S8 family peptidase [Litchfieldia alkalitelluris]|uniref:S8 family peptidase n=1 Tax=Litchfieldia alkalitelluris TaxID=304268 RepID=UPI001F394D94|nr:S8 family peptidase [Litchfieldia alkalitelluris]
MKMKKLLSSILTVSLLLGGVTVSAKVNPVYHHVIEEKTAEYIVGIKANQEGVKEEVLKLGGNILEEWKFINSLVVELEPNQVEKIKSLAGVAFVNENAEVIETSKTSTKLDPKVIQNAYNTAVAAEKVWSKGYKGEGVTVAVVDSGLLNESNSTDFKGRIVAETKTSSNAANMADFFGHGTHVAGIIGGDGSVSGGKFVGIAPGVNLVNVKISDDKGMSSEQDLVKGLEWIYNNKDKYNIRVVNISSQIGQQQSYKESATAAAVEVLWKAGVVVVVSSGNKGGTDCSVCYAPANDPFVITVGAVDDVGTKDINDDHMKSWSANGITLDGHSKPEVVAPGSEIVSYMPKGTIRDIKPENIVDKSYFKMGGTSMAAPVVSGVVALMLQVNPDLTPDQVKWILKNTTRTYKEQPEGTPGIITADAATFFNLSNVPSDVTQNHAMSPLLDPLADADGSFSNISWSNISWSNISWSNISWSNISWSNNFDY